MVHVFGLCLQTSRRDLREVYLLPVAARPETSISDAVAVLWNFRDFMGCAGSATSQAALAPPQVRREQHLP